MPIIWAVQIVNFISVVANFVSFYPSAKLGQKKTLIITQAGLVIALFGVVLFTKTNQSILLILDFIIFLIFF